MSDAPRPSRARSHAQTVAAAMGLATLVLFATAYHPAEAQQAAAVLGVGDVVADFDNTTESFNVLRALSASPPMVDGAPLAVELVDHPADSAYAVTGVVTGRINLVKDPPRYAHDLRLTVKLFARGTKIATHTTTCKGEAPAGEPDYRYRALLPCVRAQARFLGARMEEAR